MSSIANFLNALLWAIVIFFVLLTGNHVVLGMVVGLVVFILVAGSLDARDAIRQERAWMRERQRYREQLKADTLRAMSEAEQEAGWRCPDYPPR